MAVNICPPVSPSMTIFGYVYIFNGVFLQVLYLPCLIVNCQRDLLQHSCYKIMLVIGLFDVVALNISGVLSGIFTVTGTCRAEFPMLFDISGHIAVGVWCGFCGLCMLLAANRLVEVTERRQLAQVLFGGWRTWIAILIPLAYGSYFASPLQAGLTYSSQDGTWFYTGNSTEEIKAKSFPNLLNNFGTTLVLCCIYLAIYIILRHRESLRVNPSYNRPQRQVLLQSFAICFLQIIDSPLYVLMQFLTFPPGAFIVIQLMWQEIHGGNVIAFLVLNRTTRARVVRLLGCNSSNVVPNLAVINTKRNSSPLFLSNANSGDFLDRREVP